MKQIYYFGRTGGANPLASGRPVVELQHDGAHLETRAAWCRRDGGRDEDEPRRVREHVLRVQLPRDHPVLRRVERGAVRFRSGGTLYTVILSFSRSGAFGHGYYLR
jgi:hypothetical protein